MEGGKKAMITGYDVVINGGRRSMKRGFDLNGKSERGTGGKIPLYSSIKQGRLYY